MSNSSRAKHPTHAEVTNFLETFLPPSLNPETQAREVSYLYHTVRHPSYAPTKQLTSRVVFSIAPTRGVYTALSATSPRYKTPICFLHRPFNLDRRAVQRGALVLASHKSFDQHLTVGFNTALAQNLGMNLATAVCLQGYKGDDERKIGLVAKLMEPKALNILVQGLRAEFAGAGELFDARVSRTLPDSEPLSSERQIDVVAIMNAFHAEEVERVLAASHVAGWIEGTNKGCRVLYLTGAAREYGIEAAAGVDMAAFCVGHVACEEWGIRYLAQQTRDRWPGLEVIEVFEEEELRRNDDGAERKGTKDQGGPTGETKTVV